MAASSIDRLIDDVMAWAQERDEPDPATALMGDGMRACLWQLLDARRRWLGRGRPFLWKSGDVHRVLVDSAAPRLVDRHGLAEHGPTVIRLLFDYLDAADRFHPGSARTEVLRRELDRAAPKFAAAMADSSRWWLAKRVFMAILADGVDIDDDAAVWDWTAEFNRAGTDRRREVLGSLLDRQPELLTAVITVADQAVVVFAPGEPMSPRPEPGENGDTTYASPHPPVTFPPDADLAEAGAGSLLIAMLVTLGFWVDDGRKLTKQGLLPPGELRSLAGWLPDEPADVRSMRDDPSLSRWWEIALEVDILRLSRTHVVQGPRYRLAERVRLGQADAATVLEFWMELFDHALEPQGGTSDDMIDVAARRWGPRALRELYRADGAMTVGELTDLLLSQDSQDPVGIELVSGLARMELGLIILSAIEHGAATMDPGEEGMSSPDTAVELTALGRYGVRQLLLAAGEDAPLAEPSR